MIEKGKPPTSGGALLVRMVFGLAKLSFLYVKLSFKYLQLYLLMLVAFCVGVEL